MLDLRYHVASLSAVFIALIVGILVGVGISGRGFVDKSERRNFESRIAALQSQVDGLSAEKTLLGQQGQAARAFVEDTYPALMREPAGGKRIAVIVLGSSRRRPGQRRRRGRWRTPARRLALYRAIKEPVTLKPLLEALKAACPGSGRLPGHRARARRRSGSTGGDDAARGHASHRCSSRSSAARRRAPVDGVVRRRTRRPGPDPPTQRFVTGLLERLAPTAACRSSASRHVARRRRASPPGRIRPGISTVDDIDTAPGKLALALLLAGAPGRQLRSQADSRRDAAADRPRRSDGRRAADDPRRRARRGGADRGTRSRRCGTSFPAPR